MTDETPGERIAEITAQRVEPEVPALRADRPRKRIRVRWDTILTLTVVFAVAFILGMAAQYQVDHASPIGVEIIEGE